MLPSPQHFAPTRAKKSRLIFLGNLEEQSLREACIGAAGYAAERTNWDFQPWPLFSGSAVPPRASDFAPTDCLLLTERAHQLVFAGKPKLKIPHVFILGTNLRANVHSVELDEEGIGQAAAAHLAGRGYRDLACLAPSDLGWANLRAKGFGKAAAELGASCRQYQIPQSALPIYWSANPVKINAALGRMLQQLVKPCGIFAANDVIACFVIETARHLGIQVPHELGVVGVDDDPIPNAAAGMAISSVQLPFQQLGRQAAIMLDQALRGHAIPKKVILLPVRVVVRTSTDVFMVRDSLVASAQAFIEEHRHRRLKIGEVVNSLRTTTVVTLGKHFQKHLQVTPARYILLRRIEYAKELLREGRLNVQQVSDECGFHNCSYFCHVFRTVTGMNPGILRKAQVF